MPDIIYIQPDGTEETVNVAEGQSVMEGAVQNGIKGIEAECGGACSCATCHAYIDKKWRDKIAGPDEMELDMLEFAYEAGEGSRLTCQIIVGEDMNGFKLKIPLSQA